MGDRFPTLFIYNRFTYYQILRMSLCAYLYKLYVISQRKCDILVNFCSNYFEIKNLL